MNIEEIILARKLGGGGGAVPTSVRTAILALFQAGAYAETGLTDEIAVIQAWASSDVPGLVSISAVYTQSGTVYDTDSLDDLKDDLVVTAHYSDSTTETVTTYTLSGTLTEGTSTITVAYGGKTTTFDVVVTDNPYELLYTLIDSDMSITGNYATASSTAPTYVADGTTRVTYLPFDLAIGKNRDFKIEVKPSTLKMTAVMYKNGTSDIVAQQGSLSGYILDSGWQDSGYVVSNDGLSATRYESIRVMVAKSNTSETITFDDFENIKIYQSDDKADGTLSWEFGYFTGNGGWPNPNSSHTNGEMYTKIPIPVIGGHTYRFANSDSNWTSAWKAWLFADSNFTAWSSRQTDTVNGTYLDITIPAEYSYIVICSRNMENYYGTATFTDITE